MPFVSVIWQRIAFDFFFRVLTAVKIGLEKFISRMRMGGFE